MTPKINAGVRIPVTALLAVLLLGSCQDPDPSGRLMEPEQPKVGPEVPRVALPVALAMVSGDRQEGKAGVPLQNEFVVRVTDAEGFGVEGVEVTWKVAAGAGRIASIFHGEGYLCGSIAGCTDARGYSHVEFRPTTIGTTMVTAEIVGLAGSPVTFTTEVTVTVILLGQDWRFFGGGDSVLFIGPDGTPDVTVPVGTPVEWIVVNFHHPWQPVHIMSTSVPPGGESFDSGVLAPWWESPAGGGWGWEIFRFVPGVAGTWEFVDQASGATGTLTAR